MTRGGKTFLLDSLAIFLLAAALVWPQFRMKYSTRWASIESTFISDARFLRDHWPHPLWQPLWYGGTRFDYVYPPALRYGTAVLTKIYPRIIPAKAYHIYTAFFYCLGIAAVYVFVRVASGSRGAAWLAAAAAALLSPLFLFVAEWRNDTQMMTPLRWGALVRYGEGPHMTALAWLPLALAAAWKALPERRPAALAASSVCCALVVSNNFYGATALAMLFPILAWSLWVAHRDYRIWLRAIGIAALAYGLTAFWLVPSYLRITVANLQFVSEPGNRWSLWVALAAVAVFAAVSERWARGREEPAYPVFLWGAFGFLTLNVLGNYFFNFRVVGEPGRLGPELDLAMIMLAAEGLRRLWAWGRLGRLCAAVLVVVSFLPSYPYLSDPWRVYERDWEFQNRLEYQLTSWMARYLPHARALATGSVRFWYNAWYDLAQIGGGSEQGLLNPAVDLAQRQILTNENAQASMQWLLAMGVDAAIVHEKHSREVYHDWAFPRKLAGICPVLYNDGFGNLVYQVPRRYPGLARVVEKARVEALRPIRSAEDLENLRAYAEAVEKGPNAPAFSFWEGTDTLHVWAAVKEGELILAQVSYDPAWRAYAAGRRLPIQKDVLGQMLIEAPPGGHDVRLVFELPVENLVGRVVSGLSAILVLGLVLWR